MLRLVDNSGIQTADTTSRVDIIPAPSNRRSGLRLFSNDHLALSIVHDLRNPLSAIFGCAELLIAGKLDPEETRRIAGNVWRASQQMTGLLSGFASTAMGQDQRPEVSNLRAVLSASCETAGVGQHSSVDLIIDVPPEIELSMERQQIERVFLNLIVNALEAMPAGGAIHITASERENRVYIGVEDTGPGIPAEIRSRLFEPFATAGKKDGLGLGLALSRQSIRDHGGDLSAEPSKGGARFVMWLPGRRTVECLQ